MLKIKTFFLFTFFWVQINAQGIDKKWLLGYDCCTVLLHPMVMDFSSGTMSISLSQRSMNFDATIGEIYDKNNSLLFYSNGVYVANALDDTMQNGSDLNPSGFTTAYRTHGLTLPQGNLVIPFPNDSSKYYLFHMTINDNITYASTYFYYSIIDMSLDGGLGAVTQKNTVLINDSLVPGRITACKHANGRDWWVFVHQFHSSKMYKFLVTPTGIQGPWLDDLVTWRTIAGGQALFSVQGDKFVYYEPYYDLDIWDFDRCTGTFSNLVHIDINDSAFSAGAAFSPSGRYLYLSSTNFIYQFDLQSSNIDSSKLILGVYDGYATNGFWANFYLMALAPDGRIYINCANSTSVFHVINYPDSAGIASDFCQHCIQLPYFNAFTMPNFPNYFLGPDVNSVCDSLPNAIATITKPEVDFAAFPNPTNKDLFISYPNENIKEVSLYNSVGQLILLDYDLIKNEYIHFDVADLSSGLYYVSVQTDKRKVSRKFVRE